VKLLTKSLTIFLISVTLNTNIYSREVEDTDVCFDKDNARKIRIELVEKDFLVVENKSLKSSVKLSMESLRLRKEQLDISQVNNNRLADRLRKTSDSNQFRNIMWFGLGVIATGFAVKAAKGL